MLSNYPKACTEILEIFADTPDHILFEFELDEIDVLGIRR